MIKILNINPLNFIVLPILTFLLISTSNANELVTFKAGEVAIADDVNNNFKALSDKLSEVISMNEELANENNELKSKLVNIEDNLTKLQSDLGNALINIESNKDSISSSTDKLQLDLNLVTAMIIDNQEATDVNAFALDNLQPRVSSLESDVPENLSDYLFISTSSDDNSITEVEFRGVNVRINNDSSVNHILNGSGNLILGYNSQPGLAPEICSSLDWDNPTDCVNAGHVWSNNHRTGSHNLIIGRSMSYASYGNVLHGDSHASNSPMSAALSGGGNKIQESRSAIVSGYDNQVSERYAVVIGGSSADSSAEAAVVIGGNNGQTTNIRSVVIDGQEYNSTN